MQAQARKVGVFWGFSLTPIMSICMETYMVAPHKEGWKAQILAQAQKWRMLLLLL